MSTTAPTRKARIGIATITTATSIAIFIGVILLSFLSPVKASEPMPPGLWKDDTCVLRLTAEAGAIEDVSRFRHAITGTPAIVSGDISFDGTTLLTIANITDELIPKPGRGFTYVAVSKATASSTYIMIMYDAGGNTYYDFLCDGGYGITTARFIGSEGQAFWSEDRAFLDTWTVRSTASTLNTTNQTSMYYNSEKLAPSVDVPSGSIGTADLTVGDIAGGGSPFTGLIHGVIIYQRRLSDRELQRINERHSR